MKIRGKLHIENLDVQMYKGIADLADKKKDKIEEELIPSFIIEEALYYYSQLEYYEVCKSIKMFFSKNSKYTIQTTRAEWFGITCCK
jgi:hypothetical protein